MEFIRSYMAISKQTLEKADASITDVFLSKMMQFIYMVCLQT